MFRRKYKQKAPEPEIPADLEKLGLFINNHDQLRQIDNPDEPFEYYFYGRGGKLDGSSPQERMNQRRREALDECLRQISLERLTSPPYSLEVRPLPSADVPHVKILTSPSGILSKASKILIIFPDPASSSLGIFALRIAVDDSIRTGNMQAFLERASPIYDAVVIANPAMINWDQTTQSAVSGTTWRARGLKAQTPGHILDASAGVQIEGHESNEEHVAAVFNYLKSQLNLNDAASQAARKIDFLASGYTAYSVLSLLANKEQWEFWGNKMHAGVVADSPHLLSELPLNIPFRQFLRRRVRNYAAHGESRGTYLPDIVSGGCAAFSSETGWAPKIVPDCINEIIEYFHKAHIFAVEPEEGEDETSEDALNPFIPLILGDGDAGMMNWRDAMMRLDLGAHEGGWDVPGADEVVRLKRMQDGYDEVASAPPEEGDENDGNHKNEGVQRENGESKEVIDGEKGPSTEQE